jgi:hypothetical protein
MVRSAHERFRCGRNDRDLCHRRRGVWRLHEQQPGFGRRVERLSPLLRTIRERPRVHLHRQLGGGESRGLRRHDGLHDDEQDRRARGVLRGCRLAGAWLALRVRSVQLQHAGGILLLLVRRCWHRCGVPQTDRRPLLHSGRTLFVQCRRLWIRRGTTGPGGCNNGDSSTCTCATACERVCATCDYACLRNCSTDAQCTDLLDSEGNALTCSSCPQGVCNAGFSACDAKR